MKRKSFLKSLLLAPFVAWTAMKLRKPPISDFAGVRIPFSEEWFSRPIPAANIRKLAEKGVKLEAGATNFDLVALILAQRALGGDVDAAKELREAVEGKRAQRIELCSSPERSFEVKVSYKTPEEA
jgi:hypothetical protein